MTTLLADTAQIFLKQAKGTRALEVSEASTSSTATSSIVEELVSCDDVSDLLS